MSPYVKADTLCWSCLNACDNGCSWSESLTPVDGWEAERTYTLEGEEYSYNVRACPQYSPWRGFESSQAITTSGLMALLEQAFRIARRDYPLCGPYEREVIEDFLRDWLREPDGAIDELRRAARKRDEEQERRIHNAD